MSFTVPGGQNTFVPTLDLSGNLQVSFGRNVDKFPLNKIVNLRVVKKTSGLYKYFNPLDYARFSSLNGSAYAGSGGVSQFDWPGATPSPTGQTNLIGFEDRNFATRRKAYPCDLDLDAEQQADWPVLKAQTEAAAQLAMTDRALEVAGEVTRTANYPASHVDTATNWGGGLWKDGTSLLPYIKIGLLKLALKIKLDSGGNVNPRNLTIVMNPTTASKLATSAEIHDYVKYSDNAGLRVIKGEELTINATYGLPDKLYGFPLVIEDTTYNFYARGASGETLNFVFPDNVIAMVSREEKFEATDGANSYSTFHLFVWGQMDMKVETETSQWDRMIKLKVSDHRQVLPVAGVTGGLITSVYA